MARVLFRNALLLRLFVAQAHSSHAQVNIGNVFDATNSEITDFVVPSFSFRKFQQRQTPFMLNLATSLRETGLFAIRMDQDFEALREKALKGLCECAANESFVNDVDGTDSILLGDGQTVRTTLATATMGTSTPLSLPTSLGQTCGQDLSKNLQRLRDQVSRASHSFVETLDTLLSVGKTSTALLESSDGEIYSSVESIVNSSTNLEHFHVYSKKSNAKQQDDKPTLSWHTDAGLFLAFVPGHSCSSDDQEDGSSFYTKDVDGSTRRVVFPSSKDAVVIMLGQGAQSWLQTQEQGVVLRATKHALHMQPGNTRAWYGMMHTVPERAIVQTVPQERTFSDMRHSMVDNQGMAIGCGSSLNMKRLHNEHDNLVELSRRRHLHDVESNSCNNETNFFCWSFCLDIPDAENALNKSEDGYSLYCVDESVMATSDNNVTEAIQPCTNETTGIVGAIENFNCTGSWQPTVSGVTAQHVNDGHTHEETTSAGALPFMLKTLTNAVVTAAVVSSWVYM